MKHRILIISYHFPPHDTISSRRWAKFAKYLVRHGHEVVVLAAEPARYEKSPWDEDIAGIEVIYIPSFYPSVLNRKEFGFLSGLLYKTWRTVLKTFVKGTIYDRAIFWKSRLHKESMRIINEKKTDVVIANGPPHRVMYYSAQLTEKCKQVKVISDFRDPWTWWYNLGYPYLKPAAKAAELGMESYVMRQSALITVPIEEMEQKLSELYPGSAEKIKVLPHAFDSDHITPKKAYSGQCNKLVYFGNIYAGQEERYTQVARALGAGGSLDFFSDTKQYSELFKDMPNVRYHSPLKEKQLFARLIEFDAVLIVFPDIFCNYFSTKIMEIVALRLPLVLVCKEGELSRFIAQNNLGVHIGDELLGEKLAELVAGTQNMHYNTQYDISRLSFEAQTKNLEHWINGLLSGGE